MPKGVLGHDFTVLVAVGRGIFSWMAFLKDLWLKSREQVVASPVSATSSSRVSFFNSTWPSWDRNGPNGPHTPWVPGIYLIWTCFDTKAIGCVQSLLATLENDMSTTTSLTRYLSIQIHVDQTLDQDTMTNIVVNSAGSDVDPVTGLRTMSFWSKPNYNTKICKIRDESLAVAKNLNYGVKRKVDVGVYYCGPRNQANLVERATGVAASPEARMRFRDIRLYQ
jgi:hypothetical protein